MPDQQPSKRVDFTVKTKYENELPPPPFAPLRSEYEMDYSSLLTAGALSSVFLQRPLHFDLDEDFGLPLTCGYSNLNDQVEFNQRDSSILEEPVASIQSPASQSLASQANTSTSTSSTSNTTGDIGMGTSFLRRTAYMTVETKRQGRKKQRKQSEINMETELQKLLNQFEQAQKPISELKHPLKPNLKAVKAVPLLPDFKNADLQVFDTRFTGSATLQKMSTPPTADQLESSVLIRQTVANDTFNDEFVTLYAPNAESESTIQEILTLKRDLRDQLPPDEAENEETQEFVFNRLQTANVTNDSVNEVFIELNKDAALYTPVQTRVSLSRRRVDPKFAEQLEEFDCEELQLKLRELTPQESMQRDEVRSIYDPVTYG